MSTEEEVVAVRAAVSEPERFQRAWGKRKRSQSGSDSCGEEEKARRKKREWVNGMSTEEREAGESKLDPRLERVVILDAGAQYGKVTNNFLCTLACDAITHGNTKRSGIRSVRM